MPHPAAAPFMSQWTGVMAFSFVMCLAGDSIAQGVEICMGMRPRIKKRNKEGEEEEKGADGDGEEEEVEYGPPKTDFECPRVWRAAGMGALSSAFGFPLLLGLDALFGRGATIAIRFHQALRKEAMIIFLIDPAMLSFFIGLNEHMKKVEDKQPALTCPEYKQRMRELFPVLYCIGLPFHIIGLGLFTYCKTAHEQVIVGRIIGLAMMPLTIPLGIWVDHFVNFESRVYDDTKKTVTPSLTAEAADPAAPLPSEDATANEDAEGEGSAVEA